MNSIERTNNFYIQQYFPFPIPVHFMFRGRKSAWPEFFEGHNLPATATLPQRIIEVEECWIAQTYIQLRQQGLNVSISDNYRKDAINVVSYHDLAIRDFPLNCYIVAVQHDAARPAICQQRVVQNELCVLNANDFYIPHWPQPGLVPRDQNRGSQISQITFKGSECNLYYPFKSEPFLSQLAALGVHLDYDIKEKAPNSSPKWYDYGMCDLVLAVRDATEEDLKIKPASKLINAWLAGCPAMLGPEPAFQTLRRSALDFFEVQTPQDVIAAVQKLKHQPQLYSAMVENGFKRVQEYTADKILEMWHSFLSGPAASGFKKWRESGRIFRSSNRWVAFACNVFRHKYNHYLYLKKRDHGYRSISKRYT